MRRRPRTRSNSLPSRLKRFGFRTVALAGALALGLVGVEAIARLMEPGFSGGGPAFVQDPVLGYLPAPGRVEHRDSEFSVIYEVNDHNMNDDDIGDVAEKRVRIMALGDSHTFAFGVAREDAWPQVLERRLFGGEPAAGAVYKMAVIGHSLGQYVQHMESTVDLVQPHVVLVGFSMATDLWDLIPPREGGFVYGRQFGRVFFDLAEDGSLVANHELAARILADPTATHRWPLRFRNALQSTALYRRLKRSRVAMWIAVNYQPGGRSLWPSMDTGMKRNLDESDRYRWLLARRILERLASNAAEPNIRVVIVNIPYIAQIYDDVWDASFGARAERYDREIAQRRLGEICDDIGIMLVDTTPHFVAEARRTGQRFHFQRDGHPTAEGHRQIALVVEDALRTVLADSGIISSAAPVLRYVLR